MKSLIALSMLLAPLCFTSPAHAVSEPINLLENGTLDHWYTWVKGRGKNIDPKNVFTMDEGVLHISGEEWGCVTTKEEYENYHAMVEFKWGEITHEPRVDRARDSGFLIHSFGEDGGYSGTWMYCLEVQMIEGGTGDLLVVGDKSPTYEITAPVAKEKQGSSPVFQADGEPITMNSGRINWWGRDAAWTDTKDFRGAQDVEKPVGEWNQLEVIADGGKITVLLNGVVVNGALDCKPTKGRLQIQAEGAELFVRTVKLSPLPASDAAASKK